MFFVSVMDDIINMLLPRDLNDILLGVPTICGIISNTIVRVCGMKGGS